MTNRELLRLMVGQVCIHSAMTGTRLAAPLLALQLGYSPAAVGVLLALYALSPLFLALPSGRLADRTGLQLPVRLSTLAALVGAGLAAAWPVFPVLCLSAMLTGASAGTTQIALQRHVGRSARDTEQLKSLFSWIAIAPPTANFLGPLACGLLIDWAGPTPAHLTGFRAAFALMALLPLLGWLLIRSAPEAALPASPTPGAERRSVWDLLAMPSMRLLLLTNLLQSAAWDAHTFVVPILGHERGYAASTIGALLGAFAVAAALVRVVLPRLTAHVAEWRVIYTVTLVTAVMLSAYPLMPGPLAMGMCSVVLGLALGSVQPMVLVLLHRITPEDRQGEAMALRVMTINASSFLLPMVFGSIGAVTGVAGLFWLVGTLVAVSSRAVPLLKDVGRPESGGRTDS